MFNKFFQSVFTQCDNYINSTAAESVHVDAVTGTASVLYKDGSIYHYTNVSRRALFSVLNNEDISLGFFINSHLLFIHSKCAQHGDYQLV